MSKKEIKTKNKCNTTTSMGRMQKDNKSEIWECVLYLRGKRSDLVKLANRTYAGKGFSWSISKIRPESSATTMLQVQYPFRGCWGDVCGEYETSGGQCLCGLDFFGQTENSQGVRLVRAVIKRI
ncbi:MAG: hypothetical protein WCO06_01420 [Candidatus Roizmanbacteria bacterium]